MTVIPLEGKTWGIGKVGWDSSCVGKGSKVAVCRRGRDKNESMKYLIHRWPVLLKARKVLKSISKRFASTT
jgi:hypothetical protein